MNIEPNYWQIPINHHLQTNLASKKNPLSFMKEAPPSHYMICAEHIQQSTGEDERTQLQST